MSRPELEIADILCDHGAAWRDANRGHVSLSHKSVIKTTFLLYFMLLGGMMATCDEMGAVLIIGHWRPFG